MQMQTFSITEAISFGFRMFVRNFWLLLGLSLLGAAVQFGAGALSKMVIQRSDLSACHMFQPENQAATVETPGVANEDFLNTTYNKASDTYKDLAECFTGKNIGLSLIVLLIHLLAAIFGFVLLMGWNRIALDIYDRGTSSFDRIFVTFPFFLSYLIAGFLYSFVVGVGLILLIIPGIVWALKYGFFDLMIVDTGCGPIEAMTKSGNLTYGHKWQLFLFFVIYIALIAISVITIIGPFILMYILFLSRAYIFRTLQGIKQHHPRTTVVHKEIV